MKSSVLTMICTLVLSAHSLPLGNGDLDTDSIDFVDDNFDNLKGTNMISVDFTDNTLELDSSLEAGDNTNDDDSLEMENNLNMENRPEIDESHQEVQNYLVDENNPETPNNLYVDNNSEIGDNLVLESNQEIKDDQEVPNSFENLVESNDVLSEQSKPSSTTTTRKPYTPLRPNRPLASMVHTLLQTMESVISSAGILATTVLGNLTKMRNIITDNTNNWINIGYDPYRNRYILF